MSGEVVIEAVETVTGEHVAAVARLLPQLSSSPPPGRAELEAIVAQREATLLLARGGAEGEIVGMLTLLVYAIPTGRRAVIEDVVVDGAARGTGVGARLVTEALRLAAARGATSVDLTSRPSREAANRLYQRLGFERRDTNVYRFDLAH
ncbi:MAG TPA: GNAT family N-acetyltransferase [Acidimicrobiales bacterium]|nr:GNAT family N-acetyltransferase [Acidimicrobiales bacterium]